MVKKIRKKTGKSKGLFAEQPGKSGKRIDALENPPSRFTGEQFNRLIGRLIQKHHLETPEEINKFIEQNVKGKPLEELMAGMEPDQKEQAQDLAYQAMDCRDPREVLFLIKKALELDPNCIDALYLAAILTTEPGRERMEAMKEVVARAEKSLGEQYFQEDRGHFWGIIETRPYMRAREALIELLAKTGNPGEAIKHCEEMLELNPNDNQGIRYQLLGFYLETINLEGARKLIKEYEGDGSANFLWGKVLEKFLSNDLKAAERAFQEAHKENRYVLNFLTGKERLPKELPGYYGIGDRNEAVVCLQEIGKAWFKNPKAIEWLKTMRP